LTATGGDIQFKATRFVYPERANFNFAGTSVRLARDAKVALSAGAYTFTGKALLLRRYFPPIRAVAGVYTTTNTDARVFFSSFAYAENEVLWVGNEPRTLFALEPPRTMTPAVEDKVLEVANEPRSVTASVDAWTMIAPYEARKPTPYDRWRQAA
jgi:hypothetical protein